MTIPKGTLFPLCGMNLAFNRELIGPAMYFGLMGDGQPIGRYDDMWAGWCCKVFFRYRDPIVRMQSMHVFSHPETYNTSTTFSPRNHFTGDL